MVRVSRRAAATHYASIRDNSVSHPSVPAGSIHAPAITPHPEQVRLHSGPFSPAAKTDAGPASRVGPPAHEEQRTQPAMSEQLPFPFNNFTCYFTLFSKCFSSFHHCTCSLSVSRLYLALDGVYHPLCAAFPNNSTPRARPTLDATDKAARGSHPLRRPFPGNLDHAVHPGQHSTRYNSATEGSRFQI